jgi:hypothetical protein
LDVVWGASPGSEGGEFGANEEKRVADVVVEGGFAAGVAAEEVVAKRVGGFAARADLVGREERKAEFALESEGKDVGGKVVIAVPARETVEREAGGRVENTGKSELYVRRESRRVGV